MREVGGTRVWQRYGFVDAFNPQTGWASSDVIGIDLGITLLMAENLRSGLVWEHFMRAPEVRRGLQLAGFTEGLMPAGARIAAVGPQIPDEAMLNKDLHYFAVCRPIGLGCETVGDEFLTNTDGPIQPWPRHSQKLSSCGLEPIARFSGSIRILRNS